MLSEDEGAWHGDGCGRELRQDFENVRAERHAALAKSRIALAVCDAP